MFFSKPLKCFGVESKSTFFYKNVIEFENVIIIKKTFRGKKNIKLKYSQNSGWENVCNLDYVFIWTVVLKIVCTIILQNTAISSCILNTNLADRQK